jgi:hypothetical protein
MKTPGKNSFPLEAKVPYQQQAIRLPKLISALEQVGGWLRRFLLTDVCVAANHLRHSHCPAV